MHFVRSFLLGIGAAYALLILASPAVSADRAYTLDPAHTQVRFNWNHLGFSNPGANFDDVAGTLQWNADDPTQSSVEVTMQVASIHSHVELMDQKFLSDELFDVEKYPVITFTSTNVTGKLPNLKVFGNLMVHGVARPVELAVTINRVAEHPMLKASTIGFDAFTTIKRSDYGVSAYIPMVSDEVQIHITGEAVEAEAFDNAMNAAGQK